MCMLLCEFGSLAVFTYVPVRGFEMCMCARLSVCGCPELVYLCMPIFHFPLIPDYREPR